VDIGDILLIQGTLDEAYLSQWAAHLNVSEHWERALREQSGN
jgi:hypothetical protein